MKVAYMSMTGNVKRFIGKLNLDDDMIVEIADNIPPKSLNGEKYILIVPTYDEFMTESIDEFIEENGKENCLGVMGSGNLNFGDDLFIFTAHDLTKNYGIPVLLGFEYAGMQPDIDTALEIINKYK